MPTTTPARNRSETLDPSQLDGLLRIVAGTNRIDFIPASAWEYRDDLKAVLYPREDVMNEAAEVTSGQVYLKGGYAVHSQGKSDPWRHIDRAVIRANKAAGCEAVAPLSAQAVLFAIEEERVENRQREVYPNLGNHSLPRRDRGYRSASYHADLQRVGTPAPAGATGGRSGVPDFWMRAATAAKLVGSGAMKPSGLPEDMPWPQSLVEDVVACCHATTQDEMLSTFERVVAGIAKSRNESYQPPPPEPEPEQKDPPSEDAGQDRDPSSDPSEEDDGTGTCQDASPDKDASGGRPGKRSPGAGDPDADQDQDDAPSADETQDPGDGTDGTESPPESGSGGEPTTPGGTGTGARNNDDGDTEEKNDSEDLAEAKRRISEETSATPDPGSRDTIDFVSGNNSPDRTTEQNTREQSRSQGDRAGQGSTLKPNGRLLSWESIAGTTTNIVAPIRRTILQHFRDNESGELVRRLRRGRYDVQTRMADRLQGVNRPEVCHRRSLPKRRSYDVYFLVDVSGSMGAPVEGTSVDFRVFGLAENARWMMAARMVIAMSKVFDTTDGVRYAVGVHDDAYLHLKGFEEPLREPQRRRILDHVGAYGGTSVEAAYATIGRLMARSASEKKILIHLTDGEIASSYGSAGDVVKKHVSDMERNGTEVVVLTVGMGADNVRRVVGEERADEVTDATVGRILGKHLKRAMLT